jgi:hypothetical protein
MVLSWPTSSVSEDEKHGQWEGDPLAKARTSPEGEKPTECTQPPEGLEYSPHTVLNGSFSPHTEGGGLITV